MTARKAAAKEQVVAPRGRDEVGKVSHGSARWTVNSRRSPLCGAAKALVVTARAGLRESLRHLSRAELVRTCAALRPGELAAPTAPTKTALRSLAGRYQGLDAEIKALDAGLGHLVALRLIR